MDASGNVYVADTGNGVVKEIVAVGGVIPSNPTIKTLANGSGYLTDVALDGSGNVYVIDTNNSTLTEIDVTDPPSLSFATTNIGSTSSDSPKTISISNNGNAGWWFPCRPRGPIPTSVGRCLRSTRFRPAAPARS